MTTAHTKMARAFAERTLWNRAAPLVKVVYADGGTSGSLQLTVGQAAALVLDLDKAIAEVREWEAAKAERIRRRKARKDGVTLPLEGDQPLFSEDEFSPATAAFLSV